MLAGPGRATRRARLIPGDGRPRSRPGVWPHGIFRAWQARWRVSTDARSRNAELRPDLTEASVGALEWVMAEREGEIIAHGYDRVADEYEALESAEAPWPRLERVRAFAADLPRGSRILDIGCGNGVPATRELALKHEVTGVDISEEQ